MSDERIKTVLIMLSSIALALGVLVLFVVFFPSSPHRVATNTNTPGGTNTSSTATSSVFASTSVNGVGGITIPQGNAATGHFASEFAAPYPLSWEDSGVRFSIVGAALQENHLTLTLAIQVGSAPECVPLNVRLVKDESGAFQSPDIAEFALPDSGSCMGAANATYSEPLTFTLNPSTFSPYLLTTGGKSDIFFNVMTTAAGGVNIVLPSTSG